MHGALPAKYQDIRTIRTSPTPSERPCLPSCPGSAPALSRGGHSRNARYASAGNPAPGPAQPETTVVADTSATSAGERNKSGVVARPRPPPPLFCPLAAPHRSDTALLVLCGLPVCQGLCLDLLVLEGRVASEVGSFHAAPIGAMFKLVLLRGPAPPSPGSEAHAVSSS